MMKMAGHVGQLEKERVFKNQEFITFFLQQNFKIKKFKSLNQKLKKDVISKEKQLCES